jgi:signal transduction histidine kinase
VEQLSRSVQADADDRFLGQLVIRESDRLSRLLTEFLDFSRVRAAVYEPLDLHDLAMEAAQVVREHPDCSPRIRIEVTGGATPLEGDSDLLHRVLVNLILNAAQAIGSGSGSGTVTVGVDSPPADGLLLAREFEGPVRLRVTDDGPGVEPDMVERIFEPFVSGRPGGSGLGLAIVQRAVEAHRGLVFLDSAPGAGTTFTIYLHTKRPPLETS